MGFSSVVSSRQLILLQTRSTIISARKSRYGIIRHLSVGRDEDSHLLPRLYVGPHQESALPLSHFVQHCRSQRTTSPSTLKPGRILQLSPQQSNYVTTVMRMVGPGHKKGRWRFQNYDPCVRVFDGLVAHDDDDNNKKDDGGEEIEWVAQLRLMNDDVDDDDNRNKNRNRRRNKGEPSIVIAECLVPIITTDAKTRSSTSTTTTTSSSIIPILCFAPPKKKDRFQFILEKSTELGMEAWLPLDTDRSEASNNKNSVTRDYQHKGKHYVLEAAEQCERTRIPPLLTLVGDADNNNHRRVSREVKDIDSTDDDDSSDRLMVQTGHDNATPDLSQLSTLLEMLSNNEFYDVSVCICRERSKQSTPILHALKEIETNGGSSCCIVLVGPEGGWSSEEESIFDKLANEQPNKIWNTSLGSNILRTETAAVTAMAAIALHRDTGGP